MTEFDAQTFEEFSNTDDVEFESDALRALLKKLDERLSMSGCSEQQYS